jgi:hypothetical protein
MSNSLGKHPVEVLVGSKVTQPSPHAGFSEASQILNTSETTDLRVTERKHYLYSAHGDSLYRPGCLNMVTSKEATCCLHNGNTNMRVRACVQNLGGGQNTRIILMLGKLVERIAGVFKQI